MNCNREKRSAYICFVGAILVHFSIGTSYVLGQLSPYLVSYDRFILNHTNVFVNSGLTTWIFAVAALFQGFGMFVSGYVEKCIGVRPTLIVGCGMCSLGVALTALTLKVSMIAMISSIGVIFGFGQGIAYVASIRAAVSWGRLGDGFVTGSIVAAFGLSALVFGPVHVTLINPLNLSPNTVVLNDKLFNQTQLLERIPNSFTIMAAIYAIIQILGISLISIRLICTPEKEALVAKESNISANDEIMESSDAIKNRYAGPAYSRYILPFGREMPSLDVIRQKTFWKLYATYFFMDHATVIAATMYKPFGGTFIDNDQMLSLIGALGSFTNCCGRLVTGLLADRFPVKYLLLIINLMNAILYTCIPLTRYGHSSIFYIMILISFFVFSGTFVIFPLITARIFGDEYFQSNYGILFSAKSLSGLLSAAFATLMMSNDLGWWTIYISVVFTSILSAVMVYFIDIVDQKGKSF